MELKYDIYDRTEPAIIYLAKPGRKIVCALNGVDESSVQLTINGNNTHQLSFDLHQYVDGQLSNAYDQIDELQELYCNGIWFKINTPPEIEYDGQKEVKHLSVESLEIELQQYDLTFFDVNTGSARSKELQIDSNYTLTPEGVKIPNKSVTFYNKDEPRLSLLDLVLEEVPDWKVGYIDNTVLDSYDTSSPVSIKYLKDKVARFNIDNKDVYSFLTQDVAGQYDCIFVFDTQDYLVNAYTIDGLGKDTNVYLGYKNILNTLNATREEHLYTTFTVAGEDENIKLVNFGTSEIEDISYFLNNKWLEQSVIDKYDFYHEFKEKRRDEYIELSKKRYTLETEITALKDRVPSDSCNNDWSSFNMDDLEKEKDLFIAIVNSIYKDFEYAKKLDDDSFEKDDRGFYILKQIYIATDTPIVDNSLMMCNGTLKEQMIKDHCWHDYLQFRFGVYENILIEIANREIANEDDRKKEFKDWETDWDLYGTVELEKKSIDYDSLIRSLVSEGYGDNYKEKSMVDGEDYASKQHDEYLKLSQFANSCKNALAKKIDELNNRENEFKQIEEFIKSITDEVNITNPIFDFTIEEINTIRKLFKHTDYSNQNFYVSSFDKPEARIDTQYELYKDAMEQLYVASHPQYTYIDQIDNIYALPEFKDWHSQLDIFNYVHAEVRPNCYEKLRVVSISFNPCTLDNNLEIGFTTMLQYKAKRNDLASLIDRGINTAKNSIVGTNTPPKDQEYNIPASVIKHILNSAQFTNKFNGIVSDSIGASNGNFNDLFAKNFTAESITTMLLTADRAEINELHAKVIKADKIMAKVIESDEIKTNLITALKGRFEEIIVDKITAEYINSKVIIGELGEFQELYAELANIESLLAGNAGIGNAQVINLTTANAKIDEAVIKNIIAAKISVADLKAHTATANVIALVSGDTGNPTIAFAGSTQQFYDSDGKIRVQIGQDLNGKFNFIVRGEDGTTALFDHNGVTQNAIADGLIKNDMLADASISKDKMNFPMVKTDASGKVSITEILDGSGGSFGQKYTEFTSSISNQVDKLNDDLENLEIGGRNLILNSTGTYGLENWSWSGTKETITGIGLQGNHSIIVDGTDATARVNTRQYIESRVDFNDSRNFVVSFWYKADLKNIVGGFGSALVMENNTPPNKYTLDSTTKLIADNNWHYYTEMADISSFVSADTKSLIFYLFAYGGKVEYSCIKLEKGTISTDWTPAPEDLNHTIAGLSSIVDTVNKSIKDKVWRSDVVTVKDKDGKDIKKSIEDILVQSTTDINGFNLRVENLKTSQDLLSGNMTGISNRLAEVSITADKIGWLVKNGSSSSNFELTDRAADLVTKQINLKGLVTISGLASDAQERITSALNTASNAQNKINQLKVGGRNLAQETFSEYKHKYSSFTGIDNHTVWKNKVLTDGLSVGDIVSVRMIFKYEEIVSVTGKTASGCMQGDGNITSWGSGSFATSTSIILSGSGEHEFLYTFVVTADQLKNKWWNVGMRFNFVLSGFVDFKSLKVERGTLSTDWTPAPEDIDSAITSSKAFNVALSKEFYASPTDVNGNNAVLTGCASKVSVYYGNTDVSDITDVTYSYVSSGLTISQSADKRTYTVTAISVESGYVDITVKYGSLSSTKRFTVVKTKQGATGGDGKSGKGVLGIVEQYYLSTSATELADGKWENEVPTWIDGKYIWTKSIITYTDNSSTTTQPVCITGGKGINGTPGLDGKTPYLHIAYANSFDGEIDFSLTKSTNKLYIGQYSDYVQTSSEIPSKYTWTKIKGDDGKDGATGTAARQYYIETDTLLVSKNISSQLKPSSLTFRAYYQDGDSTSKESFTAGKLLIFQSSNGLTFDPITNDIVNSANTLTLNKISPDATHIKCELYSGTTILDIKTVMIVTDSDAITAQWAYTSNKTYIDGNKLYSGTITADKLHVGLGINLVRYGFDTFEHLPANFYYQNTASPISLDSSQSYYGSRSLKIQGASLDNYIYLGSEDHNYGCVPVIVGRLYRASCYVRNTSSTSATVQLYVVGHTAKNKTNATHTGVTTTVTNSEGWKRISVVYDTTKNTQPYISFRLDVDTANVPVWFDALQFEEIAFETQEAGVFSPAGATLIDGGMIITNSISAKQLTVDDIQGTNGWINLHKGEFNYGDKLIWNEGTLTVEGIIKAGAGSKIGGFTLNETNLYTNGKSEFKSNAAGVHVGSMGIGCGDFWVNSSGEFSFAGGDLIYNREGELELWGKITARSGEIGQFLIEDGKLIGRGTRIKDSIIGGSVSTLIYDECTIELSSPGGYEFGYEDMLSVRKRTVTTSSPGGTSYANEHTIFGVSSRGTINIGNGLIFCDTGIDGSVPGPNSGRRLIISNANTGSLDTNGSIVCTGRITGVGLTCNGTMSVTSTITANGKITAPAIDCNGTIIATNHMGINNNNRYRAKNTSGTYIDCIGLDGSNNIIIGNNNQSYSSLSMYSKDAINLYCSGTFAIRFRHDYIASGVIYNDTTSSAGNMRISNASGTANGQIQRSTSSSKRYKDNIKPLNFDDIKCLFDLPLYTFKYKENHLKNKNDERYRKDMPGIIVEDLDKILPIAVDHNPDGSPEMWSDKILLPASLKLIQHVHSETEQLKNLVTELETELRKLKAMC